MKTMMIVILMMTIMMILMMTHDDEQEEEEEEEEDALTYGMKMTLIVITMVETNIERILVKQLEISSETTSTETSVYKQ